MYACACCMQLANGCMEKREVKSVRSIKCEVIGPDVIKNGLICASADA